MISRNWVTLLTTICFILAGVSIVLGFEYLISYSVSAILTSSTAPRNGALSQNGLINKSITDVVDTNYSNISSLSVILEKDPIPQEESSQGAIIHKESPEPSDTQDENLQGSIVQEDRPQNSILRNGDPILLQIAPTYVQSIMNSEDSHFARMKCPKLSNTRYDYLYANYKSNITTNIIEPNSRQKYFFALDLYQAAHVVPRLLGSVVEAIKFLGPQNCELSVIEGRSDDGTFEILNLLRAEIEGMGVRYFFNTSDINPHGEGIDRIEALAALRNMALRPLIEQPESYSLDSTVIFLNDVSICLEDILELIHQRFYQNADMMCAMDWYYDHPDNPTPTFYDSWIARTMDGDSFFDVPVTGGWHLAEYIFWNNPKAKEHLESHRPFQVFSCWNGATVFTAKPILQHEIKFRMHEPGECAQGEPRLLCKDLWYKGYGKIGVVPAISLEYFDLQGQKLKNLKGYTSNLVKEIDDPADKITWEENPPHMVRCVPGGVWEEQTWVPWNESLPLS